MGEVEKLDCELIVYEGHDHVAIGCLCTSVDDGDVAVVDAGIDHAVAVDTSVEGGFGVLDKVTVEVKGFVLVVLRRGGETGLDGVGELQFELLVELARYYVDFGHRIFILQ